MFFYPKCMGTPIFFFLFVVSLFSFHFGLSNAASFQVHENGPFTDSLDDNNDYWAFVMNPNTFSSSIWIGKKCKFDGSVCSKCGTGDCSNGDGNDDMFLQKKAFVDKGGGSFFRWRYYANDIAKYVLDKLNSNIQTSYSLVKLLIFVV
ncbi:hypothetical protein Csa_000073 [Cucumis sativus]|uniref:Uncharacterized protein n=1 Tax=Cucumis sativus TaxID=3659 RepID=A0A0A0KKL7_CUCSA|nr:hypothetical protein Csa_000073 [Cucumis sativus]